MSEEKNEPLRWTLNKAGEEFGFARQTVKNRVIAVGFSPADDSTYTTKQIVAALFGDKQAEQVRLAKEQADRIALDNAERRKLLIPVADALSIARRFCFAVRQKILASALSDEEKNAVLAEIKRLAEADLTTFPDESDAGA